MQSDAIKNFNDGIACYENILHSAGIHINPLNNPTTNEIEKRMDQIEQAKKNVHHPERVQKLNRLRNYLLEINYEAQK
ncbi:hypothetical protein [Halobacterium noricense]|uniref:hypothetical protein n=1 Tax=Halobacterium noricense TaxID=223182 RepID=UPI001E3FE1CE|nr:hypothetical protein [Halobacterium noricense]UHH25620.1 hypothetical protein LT974_01450 [Halobacterium noricense]